MRVAYQRGSKCTC